VCSRGLGQARCHLVPARAQGAFRGGEQDRKGVVAAPLRASMVVWAAGFPAITPFSLNSLCRINVPIPPAGPRIFPVVSKKAASSKGRLAVGSWSSVSAAGPGKAPQLPTRLRPQLGGFGLHQLEPALRPDLRNFHLEFRVGPGHGARRAASGRPGRRHCPVRRQTGRKMVFFSPGPSGPM